VPRTRITACDVHNVAAKNQAFLDLEIVREDEGRMPAPGPLWTDDFSSLFGIVEVNDWRA